MNLYNLVNEEIKRIEREIEHEFNVSVQNYSAVGKSTLTMSSGYALNLSNRYYDLRKLLDQYRTTILRQLENHDQKIQEKIAELALTGDL